MSFWAEREVKCSRCGWYATARTVGPAAGTDNPIVVHGTRDEHGILRDDVGAVITDFGSLYGDTRFEGHSVNFTPGRVEATS